MVVGGGPTGIELSGEIHDFLEVSLACAHSISPHNRTQEDLRSWYPEIANNVRITLVEALPSVLPTFSKQLIEYTESTFKEAKIDILTKTMVKEIKEKSVILQKPDKSIVEVPCGMVVWAAVSHCMPLCFPRPCDNGLLLHRRIGQHRSPSHPRSNGKASRASNQ